MIAAGTVRSGASQEDADERALTRFQPYPAASHLWLNAAARGGRSG